MSLIVEDGTGRADAASYASLDRAGAYHEVRRNEAWMDGAVEDDFRVAALVRATGWLDATYRARFPGYRTNGRAQALEWPRRGAYIYLPDNGHSASTFEANAGAGYDQGYTYLPADAVPREIVDALCEAALRELIKPGSLAPDLRQGGALRSLQAGSVNLSFAGTGSTGQKVFQTIENALSGLLLPSSAYSGRVVRG